MHARLCTCTQSPAASASSPTLGVTLCECIGDKGRRLTELLAVTLVVLGRGGAGVRP
jgi:hypothetical protein